MRFYPEQVYHIYNRGNNRQKIFFEEENYVFFLRKMRRQLLPHVQMLCYCLMPNHFHFLVYTRSDLVQDALNKAIGVLLRSYTRAINLQEERTGSLFQQKTKAKPLNPRRVIVFGLVLLLLPGCVPAEEAPQQAAPPNIIFFVTDDQRFDMMGNMNPLLHTPHMDRLAAEGVRFENAFVTTSICAASRASLLTGTVERTHQFTFNTPPLSRAMTDQSYATLLRAAGYRTGFIGKFGMVVEPGTEETMFDAFMPLNRNPYFKDQEDGSSRHLTDITGDEAMAFLRANPADQPFMLSVSFNAPHAEDSDERQYIWPTAMDSLYTDAVIPDPPLSDPAFFEALPAFLKDPEINMNRFRWFWRFDTPEKAKAMTKGYFRMISGVDAVIGRIRDELEHLGLADNTLLILMGDNGYFVGERGYAGKWLPYEPSIRVPLLVYDPRPGSARAGLRPAALALNIDIAPTMLDLAGVAIPETMQGRSLVPLLRGEEPEDWRTDFFVEHLMEHKQIVKHEGVRGQRYKYARYFELDPLYEELYDLEADPLETTNLATDPAHAEVLTMLRQRCDELRDSYGGPYVRDPGAQVAMPP